MDTKKVLKVAVPSAIVLIVIALLKGGGIFPPPTKETATPSRTPTLTRTATLAPTASGTFEPSATPTLTDTPGPPTDTPTPGATFTPFAAAPLCPDTGLAHNTNLFHTLWDSAQGCHYDHEHGTNPFTAEVAAAFPGFDLFALLGNVQIGHTNPSSPMENIHKHGGFKWDVNLGLTCPNPDFPDGFEGAQNCVTDLVVQYHNFGNYSIELESRIHSTAALVRACNPSGCGSLYTVQFQEYGQRVTPYQGTVLEYPDNFQPWYPSPRGPYFTADCVGTGLPGCRIDLAFIRSRNTNTNSIWTSKPTGTGPRPETSRTFRLLFRIRDTYQVIDSSDLVHPFTWLFICGSATYNPAGCRWNNSTSRVHEVAGDIPAAWDGLAGFDTNPTVGRITAEGFTTRFGVLNTACVEPGPDCHPIKLVNFPVGSYGGAMPGQKVSNPSPLSNPERDFYWCNGVFCSETVPGAVPSGWIGAEN